MSTAAAALLLLALLISGEGERYALGLSHAYWPVSVAVFTATVFTVFFGMELVFSYWRYSLRKEFGISTQSIRGWLEDQAKGYVLSLVLSAAAVEILFYLILSEKGLWWLIASLLYIIVSLSYSRLFPLLFARLFYRIKPIPDGEAKERIGRLLSRLGLERLEIYTLEESSRSGSANAFVTGLGKSKRIVLFDNLLSNFAPPEVDAIVAHELGHYVRRDTAVSMAMSVAITFAAGFLLAETLNAALVSGVVYSRSDPSLLLWFSVVLGLLQFALSPLANLYSRHRESAADTFSLDITADPEAFISSEKRLCDINMMNETVPALRRILFATHPTTIERIAAAERWKKPPSKNES